MAAVVWKLNRTTNDRFMDLLNRIEWTAADSEDAEVLRDEIRSLPGFPNRILDHGEYRRIRESDVVHRQIIGQTTSVLAR